MLLRHNDDTQMLRLLMIVVAEDTDRRKCERVDTVLRFTHFTVEGRIVTVTRVWITRDPHREIRIVTEIDRITLADGNERGLETSQRIPNCVRGSRNT